MQDDRDAGQARRRMTRASLATATASRRGSIARTISGISTISQPARRKRSVTRSAVAQIVTAQPRSMSAST